jgi:hypothetical protein
MLVAATGDGVAGDASGPAVRAQQVVRPVRRLRIKRRDAVNKCSA